MSESFATLLDESLETLDMKQGSIVSGVVLDVDKDWVTVHVGLKSEGIISLDEFRDNDGNTDINVGDDVEVALEAVEDGYGETRISREKARKISTWKMLEDALESGEFVTGKIHNRVKGGFSVEVEVVKAFLPGSLVDVRPVKEAPDIENTVQEFKVIKLDYKRNNVVLSRKAVLEKNNSAVKIELLKNLDEGQIIKGVVKNITDYGAFVDLGGIDGLLHITDISWSRVTNPSEHLTIGEEIDVKVLSFDKEKLRVSLGLKQIQNDPWENVESNYSVGGIYEAQVSNITDYGCFAQLEEGIEGLIHLSELDWTSKNIHPSKVVDMDQKIKVMILEIDNDKRRISLGLKQLTENPWENVKDHYEISKDYECSVSNISDLGVSLSMNTDHDGFIPTNELSWLKKPPHPSKIVQTNDKLKVKVLEIDDEKSRLGCSLKQLKNKILNQVPGTAEASDQEYRITDLAIDFAEDVPKLSENKINEIVQIAEQNGAIAKVSSIHVNCWIGTHNKLTTSLKMLKQNFGLSDNEIQNNVVFIGDSPNDSTMFGFFKNSVGVANVVELISSIENQPNKSQTDQ